MRGRGRARKHDLSGYVRTGPVTEEAGDFPPVPVLERAPPALTDEEQYLVALNRILINYWKFQSPFQVRETASVPGVRTYSGNAQPRLCPDPGQQKNLISSIAGGEYFPQELLGSTYTPPSRRKLTKLPKPVVAASEKAVPSAGANRQDPEELEEEDTENDYGGEDYAKDHFAELEDEAEEGGLEEETIF